jgi:hypothetical protein
MQHARKSNVVDEPAEPCQQPSVLTSEYSLTDEACCGASKILLHRRVSLTFESTRRSVYVCDDVERAA